MKKKVLSLVLALVVALLCALVWPVDDPAVPIRGDLLLRKCDEVPQGVGP